MFFKNIFALLTGKKRLAVVDKVVNLEHAVVGTSSSVAHTFELKYDGAMEEAKKEIAAVEAAAKAEIAKLKRQIAALKGQITKLGGKRGK